jgi:pyruvate/2-oxoglutarate dehydrogenase complex dihydrolipoamide acyltransferase (E2) component
MFGKRSEGTKVKGLDGITRLMPLFVPTRAEAVNYLMLDMDIGPVDAFIEKKKAEEGINYTYMDITITTLVRLFKKYPKLNRFIIAGQIWQRNVIELSMIIKKSFRPDAEETSLDTVFTGYETLKEVKKLLDDDITAALQTQNGTDGKRDVLASLPLWLLRIVVWALKFGDRHGMLPANFLRTGSPFHASFFVTNLKSIGLQVINHHLFEFGNCGFFLALGKEYYFPKVDPVTGNIVRTKILQMGISMDERFVDGVCFSHVLKTGKRIFADPTILERPLREDEIEVA